MAVKQTNLDIQLQASQDHGLQQQIKMEDDQEDGDRVPKGPRLIQAGSLTDILGWVTPEHVKQEPDEEVPESWGSHGQEPLKLVWSPHLGWGNPQQLEEFVLRQRGGKRQEQQVPVGFEEMDVHSPEDDHTLLARWHHLHREPGQGLEREVGSLDSSITPMHNFRKTNRRGTNWSYAEVVDLLDIWGEQRIQQVLQSSHRNMDTFQVIANEMGKRGHERTAQECRTKTKTMRRDYKKVKESHSIGKRNVTCPFYDQLDRILDSGMSRHPGRMPNFVLQEETEGPDASVGASEDRGLRKDSGGYLKPQHLSDLAAQFSTELMDSADCPSTRFKMERTSEAPMGIPRLAVPDCLPSNLPSAPSSIPGSPAPTGSTADVHVSPSHSPLPGPMGLSAAERLANLRNRHKKTRNNLALELARAADLRVQTATDRILSALESYAKTDLEEREKDRVGTGQIIAIMHRQTELLELLIRQQASAPAALSPAPSRHARPPRIGQANHRPAGPSSSHLGVPRRPLTPRARSRRRPQNFGP
ncbi:uncharacterized protein LOC123035101 isoform X2 [Varanus komodoensis]|uniref:uncharacterized protein LOC123035101 isoform X2 n=1 Tax=Varanus komodoensis TaxID=61221 RepID=UPI001CF799C7|nr:uncharacterized protein LOC123035101 isoform X2 [Varanus komodoensis]